MTLKQMGFRLGLISNCGPDVPQLWPQLPLAKHMDANFNFSLNSSFILQSIFDHFNFLLHHI
ncbi:hypothetical protein C2W62_02190 [Candidatus Entotheonella serta]|nr:hypothetical protein C2W62_02190 [Candidatus Entotheonella serta]